MCKNERFIRGIRSKDIVCLKHYVVIIIVYNIPARQLNLKHISMEQFTPEYLKSKFLSFVDVKFIAPIWFPRANVELKCNYTSALT